MQPHEGSMCSFVARDPQVSLGSEIQRQQLTWSALVSTRTYQHTKLGLFILLSVGCTLLHLLMMAWSIPGVWTTRGRWEEIQSGKKVQTARWMLMTMTPSTWILLSALPCRFLASAFPPILSSPNWRAEIVPLLPWQMMVTCGDGVHSEYFSSLPWISEANYSLE